LSDRLTELGIAPEGAELQARRKLALQTGEKSAALLQALALAQIEALLAADKPLPPNQLTRLLDSLSTTLARAAKVRAFSLGITERTAFAGEALPVLEIRDLTGQEVEEIRATQAAEYAKGSTAPPSDFDDDLEEDGEPADEDDDYDVALVGGGNDR